MSPKGITKIALFLDFKITICVASETDVLFTRKIYVKARTICLYGLLNSNSKDCYRSNERTDSKEDNVLCCKGI